MSDISFIICCHNSERLLPDALKSIHLQRFPDGAQWEVLIIDNASTDNTRSVAKQYWESIGADTEKIRIISENRLGVGFARYRGISEARYKYICYVDDDNYLDPEFSQLALNLMGVNPRIAACGSASEGVFETEPPFWFNRYSR